jgi:hypothetical protein
METLCQLELITGTSDYRCARCGLVWIKPVLPIRSHCRLAARQTPIVVRPLRPSPSGAGTELKRLLQRIGIRATAGCRCHAHVRQMDEQGTAWCRENLPTIVGWLQEEAAGRRLPFAHAAAAALVRLAIRRAERRIAGPRATRARKS